MSLHLAPDVKQNHPACSIETSLMAVFALRVRLAGGEVAPIRLWLGDGAKWAKSDIWAHSAGWHTQIERAQFEGPMQAPFDS